MYLGIDYGRKRIGLALGEVIPSGAGFVDASVGREKVIEKLKAICEENEVSQIVLGMPETGGDENELQKEIREFGQDLEVKLKISVEFEPEQLTSVAAENFFKERTGLPSRQSGKVDELAAILILEQYLTSKND